MVSVRGLIPRFTLRTLVVLVLFTTSTAALWFHRHPWRCTKVETLRYPFPRRPERSPDGSLAVGWLDSHTPVIREVDSKKVRHTIKGHAEFVIAAKFSPDGSRLLTGSFDSTARIWDVETGECLLVLRGHTNVLYFACWSPDGTRVATSSEDDTVRLWDAGTGECLHVLTRLRRLGLNGSVSEIGYSPDGSTLVLATGGGVQVWDAVTWKRIACLHAHSVVIGDQVVCPHAGSVSSQSACFSPDGARIVAGFWDGTMCIWDAKTLESLQAVKCHDGEIFEVEFMPDGKTIRTRSWDGLAKHWQRVRPEPWWGIVSLPEFWVTLALVVALCWSILRDRKYFKSLAAKPADNGLKSPS